MRTVRLSILHRRRVAGTCTAAGALLVPLIAASPTAAVDASVTVVDFKFEAKETHVGVGDTVTWNF
jgi:plastocyanin